MNQNRWSDRLLNLLYPPVCVLCLAPGEAGLDLCAGCRRALPVIEHACPRCGLPVASSIQTSCGRCLHQPPPWDSAWLPFRYASPVDHLITGLKFNHRLAFGRVLGELLAHHLQTHDILRPTLIVPVPLHLRRLRERGFNQSVEIARVVSRRLDIPMTPDAARRVRHTPAQTGRSARERATNLKHAFAIRTKVADKDIALVDDVITTGATAGELSRVLKAHGARTIQVWGCARTV